MRGKRGLDGLLDSLGPGLERGEDRRLVSRDGRLGGLHGGTHVSGDRGGSPLDGDPGVVDNVLDVSLDGLDNSHVHS